ncbi:MAG: hypothetical protein ABSE95_11635 [Thermodesulfobacteriota bacterium]|jgi:hypothetical protein
MILLNGGYYEQVKRLHRYFEKIKNQNRETLEYFDDVWAFFQNCWHLKDWIKNDPGLPENLRDTIKDEAENCSSLKICADLTNRSKHLILDKYIRVDAKIKRIDTTYDVKKRQTEYRFYVETSDGNKMDGLSLAFQAVDDWKKIFSKFSLKWD